MYGMVNDGIRRFVVENHGHAAWAEVCSKAGVADDCFDTLSTAPDSVTYDLVGAICDHFDLEADVALKAFGEYWPEFATNTAFGKLIDFSGEGFVGCLEGLDEMHDRIAATMPHLRPPSFELVAISDTTFHLHYMSHRPGLAPMVYGLLFGVAKHFDVKINVKHLPQQLNHDGAETFFIEVLENQQSIEAAA